MLQESVKFSIIIPVYNVAEYLGFKQNWSSWNTIFEDVYTLFENKEAHTLKTLKEKEARMEAAITVEG